MSFQLRIPEKDIFSPVIHIANLWRIDWPCAGPMAGVGSVTVNKDMGEETPGLPHHTGGGWRSLGAFVPVVPFAQKHPPPTKAVWLPPFLVKILA